MYVCNPLATPDFLKNLKGVIFDCDGVLFNSLDANRQYYNLVRQRLGFLPMTPDEEAYVHVHTVKESLAYILPADKLAEADEVRQDIDYREIVPYMHMEEGLLPVLNLLRAKNIKMAINTNRTNTMELLLTMFDLEGYFFPVITSIKVSRSKPNPEGVHRILEAWKLERDEVGYIGDSHIDQETAQAAGVMFWSFKNPELSAQMHIPGFISLKQCLQHALS
ncbi:HAD family hydrolase [Desulfovibrio inopinatus]|uniref:HAD family hydrolase n=1 Tax=Desulfovibrio inopinatus TaxID=102109 RepID=UPI000415EC96|nr:HAD-IA family hydrolase [Desulfovibrio inopinatus]